jgi:hypothetical protein
MRATRETGSVSPDLVVRGVRVSSSESNLDHLPISIAAK